MPNAFNDEVLKAYLKPNWTGTNRVHVELKDQTQKEEVQALLELMGFSAKNTHWKNYVFLCRNKERNATLWRSNGLWGIDLECFNVGP